MSGINLKAFAATGIVWLSYAIFAIASYLIITNTVLWITGESTEGTVLGLEDMELSPSRRIFDHDIPSKATIVAFVTEDGKEFIFISDIGSQGNADAPGDSIPVIYDAQEPERAKIRRFTTLYLGPLLLFVLGAGVWFGGFVMRLITRPDSKIDQ